MAGRTTAGAGLAAAHLVSAGTAGALEPKKDAPAPKGPFPARAYAATKADAPLEPLKIERRAPHDVLLDVLFCGVCHSDIHQARDEWADWGRPPRDHRPGGRGRGEGDDGGVSGS